MKTFIFLVTCVFTFASFAQTLDLRATSVRHRHRPDVLYKLRIPHMRVAQEFNLTTNQHRTRIFCIPDEEIKGVWNCFDNCTGTGPGGTWGNCQYIGFCVEGYNGNSSMCHF